MKHRPRAASYRRLRRRPAHGPQRDGARTSHHRAPRKARAEAAAGSFSGIVGASATVITAEEIAHSPSQTLPEIIAQVPGVQLTSLYGGVNGAKTSVDLRGFGAFATANTLVLINGRRLNDIDMAGVDLSTIPLAFDRARRNHARQQWRGARTATMRSAAFVNIVLKNGVGGPPVAMRAEAGVGSFNQRMPRFRRR
jgi:iron complex outermembrane receptor protein